jgi:hypothetical protein
MAREREGVARPGLTGGCFCIDSAQLARGHEISSSSDPIGQLTACGRTRWPMGSFRATKLPCAQRARDSALEAKTPSANPGDTHCTGGPGSPETTSVIVLITVGTVLRVVMCYCSLWRVLRRRCRIYRYVVAELVSAPLRPQQGNLRRAYHRRLDSKSSVDSVGGGRTRRRCMHLLSLNKTLGIECRARLCVIFSFIFVPTPPPMHRRTNFHIAKHFVCARATLGLGRGRRRERSSIAIVRNAHNFSCHHLVDGVTGLGRGRRWSSRGHRRTRASTLPVRAGKSPAWRPPWDRAQLVDFAMLERGHRAPNNCAQCECDFAPNRP